MRGCHPAAEWARALPVTANGELVGMLTIEDVGQASLLGPRRRRTDATAMTI